jgi:hypothetical protein
MCGSAATPVSTHTATPRHPWIATSRFASLFPRRLVIFPCPIPNRLPHPLQPSHSQLRKALTLCIAQRACVLSAIVGGRGEEGTHVAFPAEKKGHSGLNREQEGPFGAAGPWGVCVSISLARFLLLLLMVWAERRARPRGYARAWAGAPGHAPGLPAGDGARRAPPPRRAAPRRRPATKAHLAATTTRGLYAPDTTASSTQRRAQAS